MTWLILILALHADAGHSSSEVKLPPPSSSSAPKIYEDVVFAQLVNVPPDILNRLPANEAAYLAKLARAGRRVFVSNQPWLT